MPIDRGKYYAHIKKENDKLKIQTVDEHCNKKYMLKHKFATESEAIKLFEDVADFSQFEKRLIRLSKSLPVSNWERWGRCDNQKDNEDIIKGMAFELFCELFILAFGTHGHVGLGNYVPVQENDEGVDAYAINTNKEKSAVQCKFVLDHSHEFSANSSNITNFLIEARFNGIDWENEYKVKKLFLITTASGLHYHTINKWRDCVKVINYKNICSLVDNNGLFWKQCTDILRGMNETL